MAGIDPWAAESARQLEYEADLAMADLADSETWDDYLERSYGPKPDPEDELEVG